MTAVDQATRLRQLVGGVINTSTAPRAEPPAPDPAHPAVPVIAIASGKGGVGKTSISVNLSHTLAQAGIRCTLIDGDLGLANADVLCGVSARATLAHVAAGRLPVDEVRIQIAPGFSLIPGASGLAKLADLNADSCAELLSRLRPIDDDSDLLIIDCGAGIGPGVLSFVAAADIALIVTTPEPTSITDAYALIKLAARNRADATQPGDPDHSERPDLALIVCQADSAAEAADVHTRMDTVSRRFLARPLPLAGVIPTDDHVSRAARARHAFILESPACRASKGIRHLGVRIQRRLELLPDSDRPGLVARLLRLGAAHTNPSGSWD